MSFSARRSGISLRDVLKRFRAIGATDLKFSKASKNAGEALDETLFIAVMGSDDDGHNRIDEAVANGCIAIVAERFVTAPVPVFLVEDTRQAFQSIERELLGDPASQLHTVGITGTYGKTACANILHHVLSSDSNTVGLVSDLSVYDGHHVTDGWFRNSDDESFSSPLDHMVRHSCTHAILECHSAGLANQQYDVVSLDAAIITRIRNAHTSLHGTLANYRRAKARILELLKPDGVVILNSDDPNTRFHLPRIKNPALTIGIHTDADITAHDLEHSYDGTSFTVDAGGHQATISLPLLGTHHVYHALQAIALSLTTGMDLDSIVNRFSSLPRPAGHMHRVDSHSGFDIYVDVANSADTLVMAMESLRAITAGRLIVIFGPDGDTTPGERRHMGTVTERLSDVCICTENNTMDVEFLDIAHDCMDGFEHPGRLSVIPSRIHAIDWALSSAETGDTILIAGKGFNTLHHVGNVVQEFDDISITQMLIREPSLFATEDETR